MNLPVLDLLRERRADLGQASLLPFLAKRTTTLRLGVLIGGSLVIAAAGATALVFLGNQYIQSQMANIERVEAEATALRARVESANAKLSKQVAANRTLARSLTTVRASSALLSELQLRTPDGVQLVSAMEQGTTLVLQGRAVDPEAFTRINALQLELQNSPLLKAQDVTLKKLERGKDQANNNQVGIRKAALGQTQPVDFELTGSFADLSPEDLLKVLKSHGSSGLASRLQLLQQEGLMR